MNDGWKVEELENLHRYIDMFCRLSVYLTGYSRVEITGTGMLSTYFNAVSKSIDKHIFCKLLRKFQGLADNDEENTISFEQKFYELIFFHETYGSIVKGIIKLWFTGIWTNCDGTEQVVSCEGYIEAFVWKDFEAHPMGGKPGGFGSWGIPPS
jgi:hypothetical protein